MSTLMHSAAVMVFVVPTFAQEPCFVEWAHYAVPGAAVGLLAFDLDQDGRDDLVTASSTVAGIHVRYGLGAGGLGAAQFIALDRPLNPRAIAAGDLDGDGDIDLVLGHNGLISVLLRGPGGVYALTEVDLGFGNLVGVALADVDGDQDLDCVAIDVAHDWLHTITNDGAGVLTPTSTSFSAVWSTGLELADIDGDLDPDALMIGIGDAFGPPPSFVVSTNIGGGSFAPGPALVQQPGLSMAVGDLDGDGDPDVVLADRNFARARIHSNVGGSFVEVQVLALPLDPIDVACVDLDLDGDLDLVFSGVTGVCVAWNSGGSFTAAPLFPLTNAQLLTIGDFDGDGALDIAVTRGTSTGITSITLLRSDCPSLEGSYCLGDGSGAPCPCGNEVPAGTVAGCEHSAGAGARLSRRGAAELTSDTLILDAKGLLSSTTGFFVQGTSEAGGGNGTPFGDGRLCVSGTVRRLAPAATAVGGVASTQGGAPLSVRGAVLAPGVRTYQFWYRDPQPFCTAETFNLTNGLRVHWLP